MNAYEIPGMRFSLPAGGAVAQHRFVSVTSGEATQATAETQIVGVSMNEVTATEVAANPRIVEIATGLVMVEAAGAITSGAVVYANADGKAASSGTIAAGVAITTAESAGDLVTVKVD